MPRLDDKALKNTAYLYPDTISAEQGDKFGGSCFFVGHESAVLAGDFDSFVVTNRHVIEKGSSVLRVGSKEHIFDLEGTWKFHPSGDDLAMAYFNDEAVDVTVNDPPMFITETDLVDIGIGTEVVFIGRFMGFDGKLINRPTVRFGNISISPPVEIPLNIQETKPPYLQESFLVESRSIPGFSGSPVFVIQPAFSKGPVMYLGGGRVETKLLGVAWGHLPHWETVMNKDRKTASLSEFQVNVNSGVMGVVPAWKINDLLNLPDFLEARKENEESRRKKVSAVEGKLD